MLQEDKQITETRKGTNVGDFLSASNITEFQRAQDKLSFFCNREDPSIVLYQHITDNIIFNIMVKGNIINQNQLVVVFIHIILQGKI